VDLPDPLEPLELEADVELSELEPVELELEESDDVDDDDDEESPFFEPLDELEAVALAESRLSLR
jgi:hypothetical protein